MFTKLEQYSDSSSEIVDRALGIRLPYRELCAYCRQVEESIRCSKKLLVAVLVDNSLTSLIAYLATLRSGHTLLLLNADMSLDHLRHIVELYRPELCVSTSDATFSLLQQMSFSASEVAAKSIHVFRSGYTEPSEIFPETALLLSTSGTTGSPKCVRLSYTNLEANANSIVRYLDITQNERAITSLPMAYSYGLSVINSHLAAGASLVLTNESLVNKNFWLTMQEERISSMATVPFMCSLLRKLRFEVMDLPHLRTITQAGGKLDRGLVLYMHNLATSKSMQFFVMYGQTEATARMAYLPPTYLPVHADAVGLPIPDGTFSIDTSLWKSDLDNQGEILYHGPNVMLGYAESRADLSRGDDLNGSLRTGDVGYLNPKGLLVITGRIKRFAKILGLRLNLDEVEAYIEETFHCRAACMNSNDLLNIVIETQDAALSSDVRLQVAQNYKLHHSIVRVHSVREIPQNMNAKKDYSELHNVVEQGDSA